MLNETFCCNFQLNFGAKNVKEVGAWLSLKNSSHRYDTTKALKHPPSSTHSWTFAKKCSRRHIEEAFSIVYFSHKILSKTNCIEVLVLTSLFPLFPLIKTLMPMVLYYWNISFGKKCLFSVSVQNSSKNWEYGGNGVQHSKNHFFQSSYALF